MTSVAAKRADARRRSASSDESSDGPVVGEQTAAASAQVGSHRFVVAGDLQLKSTQASNTALTKPEAASKAWSPSPSGQWKRSDVGVALGDTELAREASEERVRESAAQQRDAEVTEDLLEKHTEDEAAAEAERVKQGRLEVEELARQRRIEEEKERARQRRLEEEEEAQRASQRRFEEEERRARQRRLEEEEVERERERQKRLEEEARAAAEEQQRHREEEEREQKRREDAFWAAMTPEERSRMQGMLQAVSLYQQQLQQNERVIGDLHAQVAAKEKAVRSVRRRMQQAEQGTMAAKEQEERAQKEAARWSQKREQYADTGGDTDLLRVRHATLLAEVERLRVDVAPIRTELRTLRNRLASCEATGRAQASTLGALRTSCQHTISSTKAEQVEELSTLRANQAEELARLDILCSTEVSILRAHHAEEVSRLRCLLDEAERRRNRQRHERDEAAEMLSTRQREGAQLQLLCADARNEVLELSNQVKACNVNVRVASQLGLSIFDHSTSFAFGDDAQVDIELQSERQRCRSLERECSRAHDSLEKKQSECERWRRRSLAMGAAYLFTGAADAAAGGGALPFTLGPAEAGEAAAATQIMVA